MCYHDSLYVPVSLLRYARSDNLILSLVLAIYPSSGITCTGRGSSISDVGVVTCSPTSYIHVTK